MINNEIKNILGVKINKITTEKVLEKIKSFSLSDSQRYIVTLNPEMAIEAPKDSYFRKVINKADIVTPDGAGILWALDFLDKKKNNLFQFVYLLFKLLFRSKYREGILRYRTQGVDLIYKICESDFIEDKKVYFLGAGKGIAEKTAEVLSQKYNYLNIVGAEEGIKFEMSNVKCQMNIQYPISNIQYPIFSSNIEYNKANKQLIQRINKTQPDILFVAFGSPKQEKWIYENLKKMPSVKLAIGIGGSFDFISGKIKRAPLIFQRAGLEWLWRLMLEPWRFKRVYNATVKFGWMILKAKTALKF